MYRQSINIVTGLIFSLLLMAHMAPILVDAADRPNIIFILADDLGYSELGCYGNGFNETPNLDRMASRGLRFTQAYAAAPVCSPYRAALLTGVHPARLGIIDYLRPNSANALPSDSATLAQALAKHGYATGMIGKWHLTGYKHHGAERETRPTDHGFQWNLGSEVKGVGNGANFWPYVFRDQSIRWIDFPENRLGREEYLVDRMNLEAIEFIDRNRDRPFFLFLSHYAPHTILHGKPELVAKYRRKHPPGRSSRQRCYLCQDQGLKGDAENHWAGDHNPHLAAMLESIDDGVGKIQAKLVELGLDENTILIFSSDNGGETNVTSNSPLRGGKSQLYEGGVRVPLVVQWPARFQAGTTIAQPTMNVDFFPTLLDAAKIEFDRSEPTDGVSMLDRWTNPTVNRDTSEAPARPLFWHYPLDRPHFLGGRSAGAVRVGDWKLIEFYDSDSVELYSLKHDPSEKQNVASEHPKRVVELKSRLARWRQEVGARIPSPPLLAEPRQLQFADHFSFESASERWFFSEDWVAENGVLRRSPTGSSTTRIFLKNAEYQDAIVRFDFRFGEARELRFVTGGGGAYNAVIHIHRDHFFVQTALDKRGPYFPYRHGECAYAFEPNRWYSMTVEFVGGRLVAHIDAEHLAYAEHPILEQVRTYFAFQVDSGSAEFDNVQMLDCVGRRDLNERLTVIQGKEGLHPVPKSTAQRIDIRKRNAHEWFYQRKVEYRDLVKRVEMLDQRNKTAFPAVFQTHKEARKEINDRRKRLLKEDAQYKELLFATYRAKRAIEARLIELAPSIADLPDSRRKRALHQQRIKAADDPLLKSLLMKQRETQTALESAYADLFITDQEITERKQRRRDEVSQDDRFRSMTTERAAAYHAQQAYLEENDPELAELLRKMQDN